MIKKILLMDILTVAIAGSPVIFIVDISHMFAVIFLKGNDKIVLNCTDILDCFLIKSKYSNINF